MVRVASLKSVEAGITTPSEDGKTPLQQLLTIEGLIPLLQRQQVLPPSSQGGLLDHGVQLLDYEQLNKNQRHWVVNGFRSAVFGADASGGGPGSPVPVREQSQPQRCSGDP